MKMTFPLNLNKKERDFRMSAGIVLLWASLYVIGLSLIGQLHVFWSFPLLVIGLILSVEAVTGHCMLKGLSEHASKSVHKRKR